MSLSSKKENLLLCIALALLCFIIFSFFDAELNPYGIGSDTYEFWHLSTNLLKLKQFAYTDLSHFPLFDLKKSAPPEFLEQTIPCTARVPGYPFLLSLIRRVWDAPLSAILFNIACYLGIAAYGALLSRIFLPAGAWRALYYMLLLFSPVYFIRWGVGADFPAGFLLIAFSYHVLKNSPGKPGLKKWTHVLWAGLFGVLANFTRANLMIFTCVLTVGMILTGVFKKEKNTFLGAVIVLGVMVLSLNLWAARNKALTGKPVISTQGGYVFYKVHLVYDMQEEDPRYQWFYHGIPEEFHALLSQGKSFNEAEAALDRKLKKAAWHHHNTYPLRFFQKWADGLRTLFFFSYFDISDVLVHLGRPKEDRIAFTHSSSAESQVYTETERAARQILFKMSRAYKILLAASFFAYLFVMLSPADKRGCLFILFSATLLGVLATAFFTGAAGDRLKIPFNPFILLFAVLCWKRIMERLIPPKKDAA